MFMNSFNKYYWMTKLRMLLVCLVLIGALNWGTTAYGYNLVEIVSNKIDSKGTYHFKKIIYILVTVSALLLAFRKDTWLPFLGPTVFPTGVVSLKTPENANIKVKIHVRPNSKVVYWAAYGKDSVKQKVYDAYKDFSNSGVVMSDSNGIAELSIVEGGAYQLPLRTIKRHIHYRVFCEIGGMIGPIKTIFY